MLCLFSQVAHTPRPFSRPPYPYCPVVTASIISTAPSQAACSAPAASSRRGVWTVAVVTVEVRWCVSVQEGVGWFTGSRPGVMLAGHNSPLASTPKCLPSAPGYARWLHVMTKKREDDRRTIIYWEESHLRLSLSGDNWYNNIVQSWITDVMMLSPDNPGMLVTTWLSN